jgi:hypothetical protein
MDETRLAAELDRRFDADEAERRAVVRAARDLSDAGRLAADRGVPLTADAVVSDLADAPGGSLAERWNWWLGSLDLAYGGYGEFRVHRHR